MQQFSVANFRAEVYKYLEQYMDESSDINYLTQTRKEIITKAGEPGLNESTPKLFPFGRGNDPHAALYSFSDYFTEYIKSRNISSFDPATLTMEAKRLARLLLTSVTEIATVILMADVALAKWIERTPKHVGLLAKMNAVAWSAVAVYKHGINIPVVIVSFLTHDKTAGQLTIKFIDEANNLKLFSETGKHIIANYSAPNSSPTRTNVPWEELPKFIKDVIIPKK